MQAAVIVWERSGHWATAWRRLAGQSLPIVETRTVDDLREALDRQPASLVVLEANGKNLEAVLELLADTDRRHPHARAAVVVDRTAAACEPLVREAGAVHVVVGTRRLAPLVRMAARHVVRALPSAANSEESLADEIAARLPWPPISGSLETT